MDDRSDYEPVIGRWLDVLDHTASTQPDAFKHIPLGNEDPNYYSRQLHNLTGREAWLGSFNVGNGEDIIRNMQPSIEAAEEELVIITCFWKKSSSLDKLVESLKRLSDKTIARNGPKVRVFVGFSSLSKFQMLFHTSSSHGQHHDPSTWSKLLGLPPAETLPGLDIEVKSIFIRPFSVMHPKFVIIDRKMVWLPSCNISWESWFEGCISFSGTAVFYFVTFWQHFWMRNEWHCTRYGCKGTDDYQHPCRKHPSGVPDWSSYERPIDLPIQSSEEQSTGTSSTYQSRQIGPDRTYVFRRTTPVKTVFLPSPHHRNPHFRLPFQQASKPPLTPLNLLTIELFLAASKSIYIQTPNLTEPLVLDAIFEAIKRGVHVHIVTSERLMILEQLILAGTTTSRCVAALVKRYKSFPFTESKFVSFLKRCKNALSARRLNWSMGRRVIQTDEPGSRPSSGFQRYWRPQPLSTQPLGRLIIEYYQERRTVGSKLPNEPSQSHLKLTIVDEWTVLGSGNMDRPSWHTSQELGMAFWDEEREAGFSRQIRETVNAALIGRKKLVFDSAEWARTHEEQLAVEV